MFSSASRSSSPISRSKGSLARLDAFKGKVSFPGPRVFSCFAPAVATFVFYQLGATSRTGPNFSNTCSKRSGAQSKPPDSTFEVHQKTACVCAAFLCGGLRTACGRTEGSSPELEQSISSGMGTTLMWVHITYIMIFVVAFIGVSKIAG